MPNPNFLIIGDLKAATSSLYDYLRQHPNVYMSRPKELRCFSFDPDNEYHNRCRTTVARTWDQYLKYFAHCGDVTAIGEASPNYLRTPGTALRIKDVLPEAKLIASLRNPADRLLSLYKMSIRRGATSQPFDQQLLRGSACWIKGNFYWLDLKAYYDVFDRRQIKVAVFEKIVADPVHVTQSTYRFLGVDSSFAPTVEIHSYEGIPSHQLMYSTAHRMAKGLKTYFNPASSLRKYWQSAKKKSLRRTTMDRSLRQQILTVCRDDILRTQELVQLDLSGWLR